MKKIFMLLLMCLLVLVGCSKNNKVFWGQPIQSDVWEFTLLDVSYTDKFLNSSSMYIPKADHTFIKVEYSMKNISKESQLLDPTDNWLVIDYDGYIFEHKEAWGLSKYDSGAKGWVANFRDLEPLSDAMECMMLFEVPTEVRENLETGLKIKINLDKEYFFNLRPLDEESLEGKYNKALSDMELGSYPSAITKLEELGDYSDSKAQLERAKLENMYKNYADKDEAKTYFNENKDKYNKVSAADIGISGEYWVFSHFCDGDLIELKPNGQFYYYKYDIPYYWSIDGENFVITGDPNHDMVDHITHKFEIRKFGENKYLLYENGAFVGIMRKAGAY